MHMPDPYVPTLAQVVRHLPDECYDNPTWRGLLYFFRDLLIYGGTVWGLLSADSPWLLIPLWLLAGLAISALFVVGHDAAHGALFRKSWLNRWVGQIAMLPSLHLYEAWVFGHNRIHHGHTTRQEMDYVWHPLTPQEFAALPAWRKLVHRLEWSCLGAGLYYMRDIWWRKMIWNFDPPVKIRGAVRRDRAIILAYVCAVSAALVALGLHQYGTWTGAVWLWTKVFLIPFILWNYSIGATVYVHHICQDIPWSTRREWNKFRGQVEGTTVIHIPRMLNVFYHNIFLHVAHHVDMRIPFYRLPAATQALCRKFDDAIVVRGFNLRDYLETTKNCKLFDFETGAWSRYREAPVADETGQSTAA